MASRQIGKVPDEDDTWVPVGVDHDIVTVGRYRFGREAVADLMRHAAAAIWQAGENAQRGRGGAW